MAMDIELRNALGALTGQVQELTKQAKNLDGTLAGALDKGAKSAGAMTDSVRRSRTEMTMAEDIAKRVGRAWTSQMMAMATGAIGVTASWQFVQGKVEEIFKRMEERQKAVRDFADKSRPAAPPTLLPELRRGIRAGSPGMKPEDQATALKNYLTAGGPATEAEAMRLGQVVNAGSLLGFDTDTLSTQYAKLKKLGVNNPEDVIYAMTKEGKASEIDKLGAGRARSIGNKNLGVWNRAITDSQTMTPTDYEAWRNRTQAAVEEQKKLDEGTAALMLPERRRILEERTGTLAKGFFEGPFGINLGLKGQQQIAKAFPGKSRPEIEAEIDAELRRRGVETTRVQQFLPQAVPNVEVQSVQPGPAPEAPAPPANWATTVPRLQSPQVATPRRAELTRVVIEADNRPGFGVQTLNPGE